MRRRDTRSIGSRRMSRRDTRAIGAGLLMALCAPSAVYADEAVEPPLVIAHRGASGHQPEHTFAAYDLALEMGADYLEHDLHLTRDRVLVVLHDDTLDRTVRGPASHCSGLVAEKTVGDLRHCDAGVWKREDAAGARVPTLDAVLSRYAGRARFYIEIKHPEEAPGLEAALIGLLTAHRLMPRDPGSMTVIVQSFSADSLRRLHANAPAIPLVQLFEQGEIPQPLDATLAALKDYAVGIAPNHRDVSAELVLAAQREGLVVHPWTVNDRVEMQRLTELGVDGFFTDYPDRARGSTAPDLQDSAAP